MKGKMVTDGDSQAVLICGLGRLGQECLLQLKEFGVPIIGVDLSPMPVWRLANLHNSLALYVQGDCCQAEVLLQAGIERCRVAILVTSQERTNIAAAFSARSLNPRIRIILRSAQRQLNQLLREQLGNILAFEPSQFSAKVFALASLGTSTQAFLNIGDETVRVARLEAREGWAGKSLAELSTAQRRVIAYLGGNGGQFAEFHAFDPVTRIEANDIVIAVESGERLTSLTSAATVGFAPESPVETIAQQMSKGFRRLGRRLRIPRAALVSLLVMVGLVAAGVGLFRKENPDISWNDALNVSIVLAFGGFDNVFGALRLPFPISSHLYLFSIVITIASAVFLGIVYATLTERILSARLVIAHRRPPAPLSGHIVVVGMGPIGRRIIGILHDWRQAVVGVSDEPIDDIAQQISLETGPLREMLDSANVKTAKGVVVVMDDEVQTLEISLLAKSINPLCTLVFRTRDRQFAKHAASLIPASIGLGDYAIAAEAIAGAAFGENITDIFHLDGHSVLIAEFFIEADDTLIQHLLAEVAYGYRVVPIAHRRETGNWRVLPSDDIRLEAGDRVVILATIQGLQSVERGERVEPSSFVLIEKSATSEAIFEAGNVVARISGCSLSTARRVMENLPSKLGVPLYPLQAAHLVRELRMLAVTASVTSDIASL